MRDADPGALKLLKKELSSLDSSIEELQASLLETVTTAISIKFDPAGSDNHFDAVVLDLIKRRASVLHSSPASSMINRRGNRTRVLPKLDDVDDDDDSDSFVLDAGGHRARVSPTLSRYAIATKMFQE
uniref:Uncharacterized protein n=2 Tax=Chrysotila carterae TaxID=13221 RepID=A0A7S4BJG3_CHRCT